jgi:transcription elongation GreA/GreB family factor
LNINIKNKLYIKTVSHLKNLINIYENQRQDAQNEANFHKGAIVSRYDSFKEEAQILEDGLSGIINELRVSLNRVISLHSYLLKDKKENCSIYIGSLVQVSVLEKGVESIEYLFFLENLGQFTIENLTIQTIGKDSPLGSIFFGKKVDDEFTFKGREFVILKIV